MNKRNDVSKTKLQFQEHGYLHNKGGNENLKKSIQKYLHHGRQCPSSGRPDFWSTIVEDRR